MSRGAPRAVLLDALGTLVGLEPPWQRLVDALHERHGIDVSTAEATRALRAEMAHYREHCASAGDAATLAALRRSCADVLASELGGTVAQLDRDELVAVLLDALRFAPYSEVPAALAALRDRGARLIVVSNWDISLHEVLEQTGLRPLLDAVITSAEVGAAKPAPAIFAAALAAADADADAALHVGDSLREDIEGASAAGIEAVLMRRAQGSLLAPRGDDARAVAPAVRTIASLTALAD